MALDETYSQAFEDGRKQCCKAWHESDIVGAAQHIGQVDLMQEAFYQGWEAYKLAQRRAEQTRRSEVRGNANGHD